MDYIDRTILFDSYYPYRPVLSGIKAVDTSAESVSADLANGNTSNIGSFISTISSALSDKDTSNNASAITGIISSISGIIGKVKQVRQQTEDEQKKKEIDAYIAQLTVQVETAERKLKELKRRVWLKIGLVSLGCCAVGFAAYFALKKN